MILNEAEGRRLTSQGSRTLHLELLPVPADLHFDETINNNSNYHVRP